MVLLTRYIRQNFLFQTRNMLGNQFFGALAGVVIIAITIVKKDNFDIVIVVFSCFTNFFAEISG
ncbi:hypothetical protein EP58_09835 [Listeria newyorkensis]|nr:hypothetical protein EP58_09835 [Listeria newyorkensis]